MNKMTKTMPIKNNQMEIKNNRKSTINKFRTSKKHKKIQMLKTKMI